MGIGVRSGLLRRGQLGPAQHLPRIGLEFLEPQLLGTIIAHIEIGTMTTKALTHSQRIPTRRFVAGAFMQLDIGEGFPQHRPIPKHLFPFFGQRTHRGTQDPGGQVRFLPFVLEHQEPAVLHNELLTFCSHRIVPTDPLIPVFERVTSRAPGQQADPLLTHHRHLTQMFSSELSFFLSGGCNRQ
jgi:hypothetical protein